MSLLIQLGCSICWGFGVSGGREEFFENIIVRRAGEPLEMLSHIVLAYSE